MLVVPTCVALLPILTTSKRVMFSIPFSWWWPFIQPGPAPLPAPALALSPTAFLPFLAAYNNNVTYLNVYNKIKTTSKKNPKTISSGKTAQQYLMFFLSILWNYCGKFCGFYKCKAGWTETSSLFQLRFLKSSVNFMMTSNIPVPFQPWHFCHRDPRDQYPRTTETLPLCEQ